MDHAKTHLTPILTPTRVKIGVFTGTLTKSKSELFLQGGLGIVGVTVDGQIVFLGPIQAAVGFPAGVGLNPICQHIRVL